MYHIIDVSQEHPSAKKGSAAAKKWGPKSSVSKMAHVPKPYTPHMIPEQLPQQAEPAIVDIESIESLSKYLVESAHQREHETDKHKEQQQYWQQMLDRKATYEVYTPGSRLRLGSRYHGCC